MPIMAVPFNPPAPFTLPEPIASRVSEAPDLTAAAEAVFDLLLGLEAADALAVVKGGAVVAATPELAGLAPAEGDLFARAGAEGKALLVMGEPEGGERAGLPAAVLAALGGNAGFSYLFPLSPDAALGVFRRMASGPLNHDQPAITAALVELLAAKA